MQVISGASAGASHFGDEFALPDDIPFLYQYLAAMPVIGLCSVAMVDNDQVSVAAADAAEGHSSAVRGVNGRALCGAEICAVMVSAPTLTKRRCNGARYGNCKIAAARAGRHKCADFFYSLDGLRF